MHHVRSGVSKKAASVKAFFPFILPPAPSVSPGQSETCTAAAAACGGHRQARAASPVLQLEQQCLSEQGCRALSPRLSRSVAHGVPHVLTASAQTGTGVVTPQPFGALLPFLPRMLFLV